MTNKTYKSKFLSIALCFAMCLTLMLGVIFASGANTALAADGTAPTITHTGGIEVDSTNKQSNLPMAIVGKEYKAADGSKYKVVATGTAPLTYTAPSYGSGFGQLPGGLTLNSTTGEISGTPTTVGTYGVSITVKNAYGKDNVLAGIRVLDENSKPKITLETIPNSTMYVNSYYCENITFDGFYESFTCSVVSGTLPTGLEFVQVGYSAMLKGTPTTAGIFTFKLKIENPAGSDEKEYTIVVKNETVSPTIITKRQPLGGTDSDGDDNVYGIVGKAFEYQLQASGTNTAKNPILFFAYDESTNKEASTNATGEYELGNGLYLTKEGKIYGTPTTKGQVSFRIGAKNKNILGNYTETGWGNGYCYFQVYEEGTIIRLKISPTETSVPKGGQRQFTYEVKSAGEYTKTFNFKFISNKPNSSNTTITKEGLLTVGLDETATTFSVEISDQKRNEVSTATVTVIDHTHTTVKVPEKAADCTTDGNIEHFKCTNCGDLFSDADAVNSLTAEAVKIPASHTYGDLIPKVEATCSKAGMHAHYECSVCGKLFDESMVETTKDALEIAIDDTAHDWNAWVSNGDNIHSRTCKRNAEHKETVNCSGGTATCTQKAVCDVCRTTYGTTIPHTFGEWKEEVAPTTDSEGVKAHKDCTVCGKHFDNDGNEIENIVIAKLGSAIVTINGGSGAGSYKIGEEVTVKANEAPEGKEFKGWQDASGNIVSTDVEYKFTVSGEVNLTAVYADKAVEPVDPIDPTDPTDPTEPTIDTEEPKGLSGGAIAGITVGSVAVAGLGGFAIFWFAIKKKSLADLIAAIKGIFKKK